MYKDKNPISFVFGKQAYVYLEWDWLVELQKSFCKEERYYFMFGIKVDYSVEANIVGSRVVKLLS